MILEIHSREELLRLIKQYNIKEVRQAIKIERRMGKVLPIVEYTLYITFTTNSTIVRYTQRLFRGIEGEEQNIETKAKDIIDEIENMGVKVYEGIWVNK
ncbi:MAG: hypothetical protein QXS21_05525 [Thermoproteota archaeon]